MIVLVQNNAKLVRGSLIFLSLHFQNSFVKTYTLSATPQTLSLHMHSMKRSEYYLIQVSIFCTFALNAIVVWLSSAKSADGKIIHEQRGLEFFDRLFSRGWAIRTNKVQTGSGQYKNAIWLSGIFRESLNPWRATKVNVKINQCTSSRSYHLEEYYRSSSYSVNESQERQSQTQKTTLFVQY